MPTSRSRDPALLPALPATPAHLNLPPKCYEWLLNCTADAWLAWASPVLTSTKADRWQGAGKAARQETLLPGKDAFTGRNTDWAGHVDLTVKNMLT
jgi:hypothetical protein